MRKRILVSLLPMLVASLSPAAAHAEICEPTGGGGTTDHSPWAFFYLDDSPAPTCEAPGGQNFTPPPPIENPEQTTGDTQQPQRPAADGPPPDPTTDPVQENGEFAQVETDISLPGRGLSFDLVRTYRSRIRYRGALGWNWTHSYDRRLYFVKEQSCGYRIDYHDGRFGIMSFREAKRDASTIVYAADPGVGLTLEYRIATKEYVVRDGSVIEQSFQGPAFDGADNNTSQFGALRTLTALRDLLGNQQTIQWAYDVDGFKRPRILSVTDTALRTIQFHYSSVQATDEYGRAETDYFLDCISLDDTCNSPLVRYQYDKFQPSLTGTFGELVTATDATGTGNAYIYDERVGDEADPKNTMSLDSVVASCQSVCGKPQDDCHNIDLCGQQDATCQAQSILDPANFPLCQAAYQGAYPYCAQTTTDRCVSDCVDWHIVEAPTGKYSYVFGAMRDLNHNLMEIDDTLGNRIVKNEYGADPSKASFDRVTKQWMGTPTAGGDANGPHVTMEYHRLDLEQQQVTNGNVCVGPQLGNACLAWVNVPTATVESQTTLVSTGQRGSAASVSSGPDKGGGVTITGVPGVGGANVANGRQYLTLSGASSPANNGNFPIVGPAGSASSVTIFNPRAVANDASNGSISWTVGAYPATPFPGIDDAHVLRLSKFASVDICTGDGLTACGDVATTTPGAPTYPQFPELATVVTDVHGAHHTSYLDHQGRLLRSVTFQYLSPIHVERPYETTDYNYPMGDGIFSRVERHPAGDRRLTMRGAFNLVQLAIDLPAPGSVGDQAPATHWFGYDANGQLTSTSQGTTPRIPLVDIARDPKTSRILSVTKHVDGVTSHDQVTTYDYSNAPQWYVPSSVTNPDGTKTVNDLFDDDSGTAQRVTADATGGAPVTIATLHDPLGRVTDQSRFLGSIPLRAMHYDYEANTQRVHSASQFDLLKDPSRQKPYTTTFEYAGTRYAQYHVTPDAWTTTSIDQSGNLVGQTSFPSSGLAPSTRCYDRASDGQLLHDMLPEGQVRTYSYDAQGRVTGVDEGYPATLPDWAQDCAGSLDGTKAAATAERVQTNAYQPGGAPLSQLDGSGVGVHYVTDGYGRVVEAIDSTGNQRWQGYDAFGNVAWIAHYDARVGRVCRGCGPPATYGYPSAPWSGLQSMEEMQYDYLGRVTQRTRWEFTPGAIPASPTKLVSSILYDDKANTVTAVDESGATSQVTYDGASRPVARKVFEGLWSIHMTSAETARRYGNFTEWTVPSPTGTGTVTRTSQVDAFGTTLVEYNGDPSLGDVLLRQDTDVLGRVVERSERAGARLAKTTYDSYGHVSVTETDTSHDTTTSSTRNVYGWNRNGQLASFTDGNQHSVTYLYDGVERLQTKQDALGRATTYAYETGSSRVHKTTLPGATTIANTYVTGLLQQQDVVNGVDLANGGGTLTRKFAYDSLDRITSATVTGSFAFRTRGTTVTRSYDSLGTMISEKEPFSPVPITRDYDPTNRTLTTQWGSATITHAFDQLGRTSEIDLGGAGNVVMKATYALGRGPAQSVEYGNGVTTTFGWDLLGRTTGFSAMGPQAVAAMRIRTDANGSPLARETTFGGGAAKTELFQVDDGGRLLAEGFGGSASVDALPLSPANTDTAPLIAASPSRRAYGLDDADNWLTVTPEAPSAAASFVPDVTNGYSSIAGAAVRYDSMRNVVAYPDSAPTETYAFDGAGELLTASVNGATTTFAYDALGRRAYEKSNGTERFYVWDGSQILAVGSDPQQTGNDVLFVRSGGSVVAVVAAGGTGARVTLHAGWDGSTVAASDASGNLVEAYSYTAYGETTILDPDGTAVRNASAIGNPFLYQGQYYDAGLRAYRMGLREYKPAWGRFLSGDPIGIGGGQNAYAFVNARPLTFADPTGLYKDPNADQDGSQGNPNLLQCVDATCSSAPRGSDGQVTLPGAEVTVVTDAPRSTQSLEDEDKNNAQANDRMMRALNKPGDASPAIPPARGTLSTMIRNFRRRPDYYSTTFGRGFVSLSVIIDRTGTLYLSDNAAPSTANLSNDASPFVFVENMFKSISVSETAGWAFNPGGGIPTDQELADIIGGPSVNASGCYGYVCAAISSNASGTAIEAGASTPTIGITLGRSSTFNLGTVFHQVDPTIRTMENGN